jgi:hypothetical protein
MDEIKLINKDGCSSCEVPITKEQWKTVLRDKSISNEKRLRTLLYFYAMPNHTASCTDVSIALEGNGGEASSLNAIITNYCSAVLNKMGNPFQIKNEDGQNKVWPVIMGEGRMKGEFFEWTIRKELAEAIDECLINDTVKLNNVLNGFVLEFDKHWNPDINDEEYKWRAIATFQKNWDIDATDFVGMLRKAIPYKTNLLTSANYFPGGMLVNDLAGADPDEVRSMFRELYDESTSLNERVFSFSNRAEGIRKKYGNEKWKSHFQDARAISTYLWLRYPDKYYIYKYGVYLKVAELFGSIYKPLRKSSPMAIMVGNVFYNKLCTLIGRKPELRKLLDEHIALHPDDTYSDPQNKTLTIDFGYFIYSYYNDATVYPQRKNGMETNKYIELLNESKNLVLTGAPGTGKTYLAKQIAKDMGAEWKMVQFHPSYDYTDFVEGLRPVKDAAGNVAFERKDGVFKKFCKEALTNLLESQKSAEALGKERSIDEKIDDFLNAAMETDEKGNQKELETISAHTRFYIVDQNDKTIHISIPDNPKVTQLDISRRELYELVANEKKFKSVKEVTSFFNRKHGTQQDSYLLIISNKILEQKTSVRLNMPEIISRKPFVFIIDEINRGEISKIFGELFFSIEPSYRGKENKVDTQYQEMVEEDDVFKKGFFVPENVYVIGTMNDIDRSVESMDFAMRRRFTWQEITAEESADNMGITGDARNRMDSLNNAIAETDGLGQDFQIGGAIFLSQTDMDKLWRLHLSSLLHEYLRGMPDEEEKLIKLKEAFNLKINEDE